MFLHQNENSTANRNNQTAQKSQKEKTMAASPANSMADIDITKPLTQEEQAMILQHTKNNASAPGSSSNILADYYPGKYSENNFGKEEAATKGFITSFVGSCTSENGTLVNLGKDVAFVQKHLNRLGILSDEDYTNEKPKTDKEISKNELTATIEAIGYFQERVMHTAKAKVDQQVWPGYETINSLANITLTESSTKLFEYTKKQVREKIEETIKEMFAAREAEIERIKNKPATDENVSKLYEQTDDVEAFGRMLKFYALYNPDFVLKAYSLVGYSNKDNLTRAIMRYLNDAEIQQLSFELDAKFYDSMATGVTTDEEYELMKKLKKGRGVRIVESEKEDDVEFQKVDESYKSNLRELYGSRSNFDRFSAKSQLQGSVGADTKNSKAMNHKEDVELVKRKLAEKDKNYIVKTDALPDLIKQIESFQQTFLSKKMVDGNISKTGITAKKLSLVTSEGSIGGLTRTKDSQGNYSHEEGTDEGKYYSKVDAINENLVKKGSKEDKILKSAKKAATDEAYFKEVTKEISAELDWNYIDSNGQKPKKEIEGRKLSSVLEQRIIKFHKFCVALGIYKGNMIVTNAVRSKATAHKWSTEHFILYKSKSRDHSKAIGENLTNMYNNPEFRIGKSVKDKDGNIWAHQNHFVFEEEDTKKEKAIDIKYDELKLDVEKLNIRTNKESVAAEGYEKGDKRLPLPVSGHPWKSKHITGNAIDINSNGFINKNDAIIDLVALNFGVVRSAPYEQWHFENTDLRVSSSEQKLVEHE